MHVSNTLMCASFPRISEKTTTVDRTSTLQLIMTLRKVSLPRWLFYPRKQSCRRQLKSGEQLEKAGDCGDLIAWCQFIIVHIMSLRWSILETRSAPGEAWSSLQHPCSCPSIFSGNCSPRWPRTKKRNLSVELLKKQPSQITRMSYGGRTLGFWSSILCCSF